MEWGTGHLPLEEEEKQPEIIVKIMQVRQNQGMKPRSWLAGWLRTKKLALLLGRARMKTNRSEAERRQHLWPGFVN